MAKHNFGGVYANMDFPPYEFQPYPKHVKTGPSGEYEIAFDEAEERKIKARLQEQYENAPAETELFVVDPEKEILISRARELGVPINRKWSKEKLTKVVREAEAAIDDLPPEDEEDNFIKTSAPRMPQEVNVEPETTEIDKDALIEEAKLLGLPATKLWGVPRLQAAIAEITDKK